MNEKAKKTKDLVEIVPICNTELKIKATAKLDEEIQNELKISDRALSAEEIKKLYEQNSK